MMKRGGNPGEENSIGPGALRFDSDNRTSNHHFRQQFSRQFNSDSAGGRLAAAAALPADFNFCNTEYAGSRRLATAATLPANLNFCNSEYASGRRLAAAAALPADFNFDSGEYASSRWLATAAALSAKLEHAG